MCIRDRALGEIAKHVGNITQEYEGTKEFEAKSIRKVIRNKKIYVDNPHGDGVGVSQAVVVRELAVNLYGEDWYVYEDNFGTTEEKAFVKYFRGLVHQPARGGNRKCIPGSHGNCPDYPDHSLRRRGGKAARTSGFRSIRVGRTARNGRSGAHFRHACISFDLDGSAAE